MIILTLTPREADLLLDGLTALSNLTGNDDAAAARLALRRKIRLAASNAQAEPLGGERMNRQRMVFP